MPTAAIMERGAQTVRGAGHEQAIGEAGFAGSVVFIDPHHQTGARDPSNQTRGVVAGEEGVGVGEAVGRGVQGLSDVDAQMHPL